MEQVLLTLSAEALAVVDEQGRRWLQPASRIIVRVGDVIAPAMHGFALEGAPQLLADYSSYLV